jgi:hypothetical protein
VSYASKTTVPVDRSKAELEALLGRYGADQFAYMTSAEGAMIAFRMRERHVRFLMPMPDQQEFRFTPGGRRRTSNAEVGRAWQQAIRSRWRALVLIVKAKLEAVEAGVSTFEREFLADIMLPDGTTVHEWLEPQIEEAYSKGSMPGSIRLALPEGKGNLRSVE